jgi:hypothetical protein
VDHAEAERVGTVALDFDIVSPKPSRIFGWT